MMSLELLNLNWHTYSDHLKEIMQNLMDTHMLSDVTLVCDDKIKSKAHKFVLSACSPVFQSIIDDLPQKENSSIYLKGILSQEMKSILQFMYLGQATFYQDRMNEFLEVAKTLEIKEIGKDVDYNADVEQENDDLLQRTHKISNKKESTVLEEIWQSDNKPTHFKSDKGTFQCNKCDKLFSNYQNLHRHYKSAHEGMKFPCDNCGFIFNDYSNLIRHKKNKH